MSDYRAALLSSIEESLSTMLDNDTLTRVSNKITCVLSDYEVTKRCTDLVVYEDLNERLIKRYCACLLVDGKSKGTIAGYARQIRKFADFTGTKLTDVGIYDIRYYLACEKERGISDRYAETIRSYISAFYQWLTNEDIITKNPCSNVKPIKYADKRKIPLSSVELDEIRQACMDSKERALIEFLVTSGVRVDELVNLEIADVNLQDMSVHVRHGKGNKERVVYINDIARSHLQKYLMTRSDPFTALFISRTGNSYTTNAIRTLVKKIGKRAGVSNVHPHRFRRTLATNLALRGMSVQDIQRILGHANIATTMEYICIDDTKVRASYQQCIA